MEVVELSCIPATTVCICVGVNGSARSSGRLRNGGLTGLIVSSPPTRLCVFVKRVVQLQSLSLWWTISESTMLGKKKMTCNNLNIWSCHWFGANHEHSHLYRSLMQQWYRVARAFVPFVYLLSYGALKAAHSNCHFYLYIYHFFNAYKNNWSRPSSFESFSFLSCWSLLSL